MPDSPPISESPPVPPPPGSSASAPVGTVEVTVLVDGSPVPLCHIRVASGVYDEVGLFVDPTANPLVFTDVPETTSGLLQTYCYPTLYPGCAAVWSATWPGGSYPETEVPDDGAPFGPLTVVEGGTTEVLIAVTCATASGSSPPPSTSSPPAACCPPVPWCLEGGGWDVFPVGDRPAGVVGRPLRSADIAERDCPPLVPSASPPVAVACGDCEYTVSGLLAVSLENATGDLVDGTRYMDFDGLDASQDQCVVADFAGLFPTTHYSNANGVILYPGLALYLTLIAGPTGVTVQWMVWAQNMDLRVYTVVWVDIPAGYSGLSYPPLTDFLAYQSDSPLECGTAFYGVRTYIGRIRLQSDDGLVVYGEADVYAQ